MVLRFGITLGILTAIVASSALGAGDTAHSAGVRADVRARSIPDTVPPGVERVADLSTATRPADLAGFAGADGGDADELFPMMTSQPTTQPSLADVTLDPSTGTLLSGDEGGVNALVAPPGAAHSPEGSKGADSQRKENGAEPQSRSGESMLLGGNPGEVGGETGALTRSSPAGKAGSTWQMLGALALVVGLILALKWLSQRFAGQRRRMGHTPVIEVLTRTVVSPKHSVMLLRVGPRLLVVGAGADGMNTLAEIDDPEQAGEVLGAVEQARNDSLSQSFRRTFDRVRPGVSRGEPVETVDGYGQGEASPLGEAAEQLRAMMDRVRRIGGVRKD